MPEKEKVASRLLRAGLAYRLASPLIVAHARRPARCARTRCTDQPVEGGGLRVAVYSHKNDQGTHTIGFMIRPRLPFHLRCSLVCERNCMLAVRERYRKLAFPVLLPSVRFSHLFNSYFPVVMSLAMPTCWRLRSWGLQEECGSPRIVTAWAHARLMHEARAMQAEECTKKTFCGVCPNTLSGQLAWRCIKSLGVPHRCHCARVRPIRLVIILRHRQGACPCAGQERALVSWPCSVPAAAPKAPGSSEARSALSSGAGRR